ncbi:MAG: DNA translocase FtsK [Patescibacteria group bacterium]
MTRKKKKDRIVKKERKPLLHQDTFDSIVAVSAFLGALAFVLARFGLAGKAGELLFRGFAFLVGGGYFLIPFTLILFGFALLFSLREHVLRSSIVGALLLVVAGLGLADVLFGVRSGGFLGEVISKPFLYLFDRLFGGILLGTGVLIAFLILFGASLRRRAKEIMEAQETASVSTTLTMEEEEEEEEEETKEPRFAPTPPPMPPKPVKKEDPGKTISRELLASVTESAKNYILPPLSLLSADQGKPSAGDVKGNSNIIQRTLKDFGVPVEMAGINIGPSVTQFTLKPAQGVRLSRIVALQSELALALAAHPLRVEAPIPGQALVGIEVPNRSVALVGLRNMLEQEEYQKGGPLTFALGRDVSGKAAYADLARMPHLLVAGATGSGKSVAIHAILTSLLYKNTPLSLKLLLIDPKRVEMTHYQDIPHLVAPVITSAKDSISALRWTVKQMEERYKILEGARCRDIISFNSSQKDFMPYIVVVIDELADLMMSFGREVESSIVRISQMARAVGIHLILATQRPSVEVITGLIKANITSRIGFQVASQIDSRTILDMAGSEKLLGSGDMLYLAADMGKPRRIQGGFVSEAEVKKVTEFIREQDMNVMYNEEVTQMKKDPSHGGGTGSDDDEEDPRCDDAQQLIVETGKASITFLQRHMKLGYGRAARIMDQLERRGVIGPGEGAKPREILVPHGQSASQDEGYGIE